MVPCAITSLSDDDHMAGPRSKRPRPNSGPRVVDLSDSDGDSDVEPIPMRLAPTVGKRAFIEVFAGSHHLSDAFSAGGHRVFPMDVKLSIEHDMHGLSGIKLLKETVAALTLETGMRPYIHFAPPCSTYSMARFPKIRSSTHPSGLPGKLLDSHNKEILAHANRITINTFRVMTELFHDKCLVSLEQPSTSLMLKTKEFKSWASQSGAASITVDYCMFGMPYRKRTSVWTSPPGFLDKLERKCPGDHIHERTLSGWSYNKGSRLPTSHGCSAYPEQLCAAWCRAFACLSL